MRIIFRVNASKKIGGGHLSRCLTLADALSHKGAICEFITNETAIKITPSLQRYKTHVENTLPFTADFLVVDHYNLDTIYEKGWRPFVKKIMVIDDLANRVHDCDFLLDQTYGQTEEAYAPYTPKGCHLFLGARYALLRPQFANLREKSINRRQKGVLKNILVTYGSVDMYNLCPLTLEALKDIKTPLEINIVCEKDHPKMFEMISAANSLEHKITFHHNVTDMATLMHDADLALGSVGTTSWERCTLGVPTLVFQVADNQSLILQNLGEQGSVSNLGHAKKATATNLSHAINNLIEKPHALKLISEKAAQITDGKGVEEVAKTLISQI